MIRLIKNIYQYSLCSIVVLVFLSSHSYSQDDVDVNNENAESNNSVKNNFPIVVFPDPDNPVIQNTMPLFLSSLMVGIMIL
mgnify:CR=1 FL=1